MNLSCQDTLSIGSTFVEKYENIKKWGFDGVEISGSLLLDHFEDVKKALKISSLKASTICSGFRGWLLAEEKEDREKAVNDIKYLLECAAELEAVGVITPSIYGTSDYLPYPPRKRNKEEDKVILIESLIEIGNYAEKIGVLLLLEPLLRYQTHLINSLDEGVEIIEAVNSKGIALMADFFHMQMEEKDIADSLRRSRDVLKHIHLSDSNRLIPGQGHTDFKTGIEVLHSISFDKYMAFEAIPSDNPDIDIPRSVNYIRGIMN